MKIHGIVLLVERQEHDKVRLALTPSTAPRSFKAHGQQGTKAADKFDMKQTDSLENKQSIVCTAVHSLIWFYF